MAHQGGELQSIGWQKKLLTRKLKGIITIVTQELHLLFGYAFNNFVLSEFRVVLPNLTYSFFDFSPTNQNRKQLRYHSTPKQAIEQKLSVLIFISVRRPTHLQIEESTAQNCKESPSPKDLFDLTAFILLPPPQKETDLCTKNYRQKLIKETKSQSIKSSEEVSSPILQNKLIESNPKIERFLF